MGVTAFRIAARSNADLVQRHALRHSLGSERQIHDPPEPVQTRLNLRQVSGPKHALAGPGKFDRRHDQRLARREVVHHRAAAHARSIGNLDVGDGPIAPLIEALDRASRICRRGAAERSTFFRRSGLGLAGATVRVGSAMSASLAAAQHQPK